METDDIDDAWGELVDAPVPEPAERPAEGSEAQGKYVGDALSELIMGVNATTSLLRLTPDAAAPAAGVPGAGVDTSVPPKLTPTPGPAADAGTAGIADPEPSVPKADAEQTPKPASDVVPGGDVSSDATPAVASDSDEGGSVTKSKPAAAGVAQASDPSPRVDAPLASESPSMTSPDPFAADAARPSRTGWYVGLAAVAAGLIALVAWPRNDAAATPQEGATVARPVAVPPSGENVAAAPGTKPVPAMPESELPADPTPARLAVPPVAGAADLKAGPEVPPPVTADRKVGASSLGFATNSDAYVRAAAAYELSPTPALLLEMTVEACKMDDGPRARAAFRKLGPSELRKEAFVACRAAGVNVRAAAKGPTAAELVRRAERLLEEDARLAFETARSANRLERRSDAVMVMGRAACALSEPTRAASMLRHLGPDDKAALIKSCAGDGVALDAEG